MYRTCGAVAQGMNFGSALIRYAALIRRAQLARVPFAMNATGQRRRRGAAGYLSEICRPWQKSMDG
jgi:hypothetical protein